MATTQEVLDNHLKRFYERDLEGILSDYAPGAILFTPNGPLKGRDEIGSLFTAMFAEFAKPGAAFNMGQQFVDGDYRLHPVDGGDRRQRLRTWHGHVLCTRRQDHGSVIRGQDDRHELKADFPRRQTGSSYRRT